MYQNLNVFARNLCLTIPSIVGTEHFEI